MLPGGTVRTWGGVPGHLAQCDPGEWGHGAGDRGLMCAVTRCMTYTAAAASWSSMRRESLLVKGGLRSGGLIFE